MRKPSSLSDQVGPGVAAADPGFAAEYPCLYEQLSCIVWDDGSPRETSTLMVLCEQGVFKLGLNDRASLRSTWVSGDTLNAALEALESGLSSGRVEWRSKSQTSGRKR